MRVARSIDLTPAQRELLEQKARGRSLPARQVERARIVLRAADGWQDKQIAAELGITPQKAARWRRRYLQSGMAALEKDAPRPGRPRRITAAKIKQIIDKTTREKPTAATHWSTRTMAAAVSVSEATVRRIWQANGLKPHLARTFKVSNDPQFARKAGVHRRPLPESSRARHRALRRREEPDPSLGSDTARIAVEEGPLRNDDARLQAQWNGHFVCRHEHLGRDGDQHV